MSKPGIIDYPKDRSRLRKEFGKIAAADNFSRSVAMAKEVFRGRSGKVGKRSKSPKSRRKR